MTETHGASNSQPTSGTGKILGQRPLNISIVGAGIGGLMAAIGLRRNGHNVSIYEQSRFASELGAAIHLCPNANGLLRQYGIIPESFGAVTVHSVVDYSVNGTVLKKVDVIPSSKMWQHPWQLCHRVKLHETLKKIGTSEKGAGKPAKLMVSSRVNSVDPESASIILESGEKIEADLVVGADGIRSQTRNFVVGHSGKFLSSGKAAFRFLIPRGAALSVEGAWPILKDLNQLSLWYADDRRVVMYPCNDNELLNFVCIHPEGESQGSAEEWNKEATIDHVLKVYKGFDPRLLDVIRKADPESIKVWKLLDMEVLPTFIRERLALIGDAAHPFLPHQGQGGGVAMEDATALAGVFPPGSKPEEVSERLKLYNKIRYERANTIQEFSRQAGADFIDGKPQIDMMKYIPYNFGHDEFDNTAKLLERWERARNPKVYQRMPLGFGISLGPRQDIHGRRHPSADQTFVTASIRFKTSRTFLQNLFATDSFMFKSPATVVDASFKSTTLNNMSWLGGGGYNHFGLYIHGVTYMKQDGSLMDGMYLPILFEDLADPIITGRDELGMPKVYCELDIERESSSYSLKCSWRGASFAKFVIQDLRSETGQDFGESETRTLAYKYVPSVGEPGKADCEYPVVFEHLAATECIPQVKSIAASNQASFSFDALDAKTIPTLHHIVSKLANIPVYGIVDAKVVGGTGVPDLFSARRIE